MIKHVKIMQTVQHMAQIEGHENETLVKAFTSKLSKTQLVNEGIQSQSYLKDTVLEEQFLETKDFFY